MITNKSFLRLYLPVNYFIVVCVKAHTWKSTNRTSNGQALFFSLRKQYLLIMKRMLL